MSALFESALWGAAVGGSLLAGALLAVRLKVQERAAAVATTFGGGLLLAALAFELVPEADERAGTWWTAAGFATGTLVYLGADAWLTRDANRRDMRRSMQAAASGRSTGMTREEAEAARGESIAAGLFVDGVPESVALGLAIAEGGVGGALLVGVLVGNVVEAYGSAQPIVAGGRTRRFAIGLLAGIGLALAGATILGGTVLADVEETAVGFLQALAGGAVHAVVLVAVVPHAFAEVNRWVAAAAAGGFLLGYLLS
jgi:zinc transporter, ZIP family